ncbi:hypothetical protein EMIHUDRAFT_63808 [Emiliania huxleyi CCMP1516]|uniref:DNA-directed RNA polymerase subunit n=2 Tax=Emiliania huxleyi TaxID=2903 RepID=A0A0D3K343_EMIH1|nr:hypothetical protein EMIHUDRAFT_64437 [Emiliania huxleyi CCMP1516]XP_005782607.1 hypothetical protein EMIHUDRAFT_63808 [Emiliania huxleyi CCMP1516]EOD27107.1 hypothetical protein EMIHUDRAFT_64437 [Emiliania huxleyi CCMP1516]EOD30178.1 hypothetical protein EMIHUDRAFT_63808 [Emiliania huxleyi CCMP1516]|eukprot:XP_005779536.1 hypothetical protein EMIHUDRAFT_64437 [Emiliania huxleyi CCMP1516]
MFCDCCGALLREPTQTGTSVECHLCGAGVDAAEFEALVVTTAGKDHVLGANLARGGVQADTSVPPPAKRARAVVKEACPQCAHPELQYYTMQLRSADEGQTVFYECEKCGHTYSTNT